LSCAAHRLRFAGTSRVPRKEPKSPFAKERDLLARLRGTETIVLDKRDTEAFVVAFLNPPPITDRMRETVRLYRERIDFRSPQQRHRK
jgi:hypothetical protein